jgi:hypothetical protein
MRTPDRDLEDTRQPDESRFSDYGFECEDCGAKDLTVDETTTVITYPHGINRGMVDKIVCLECYEKYTPNERRGIFERDALDLVREEEESE